MSTPERLLLQEAYAHGIHYGNGMESRWYEAVKAVLASPQPEADSESLGRAFDQAIAECTGSIMSQYSANLIRKRANEIVAMRQSASPQ